MNEAVVIIGFLIIFAISEALFRKKIFSNEHARKFTHVLSGLWTLFTPFLISFASIVWIAAGFTVLLAVLHKKTLLSSISISKRTTYGSITMPMGIACVATFFPSIDIFLPSIAVLTFADAAAGLMGRGTSKTLPGSIIFFLVAFLVLLSIPPLFAFPTIPPSLIAITVLILTGVEYISPLGFDNLTVPLAAALLLNLPIL